MSQNSKIEWTDATWNVTLGCSKVSPGCKHCYAINHVHRMAGNPNKTTRAANQGLTIIEGGKPNWSGEVRLIPERLEIPLRRRKPTWYFVNALSDLFHESLTDEAIDQVFAVMALCPQHTFQVLTKRPQRMSRYFGTVHAHGLQRFDDVRKWMHLISCKMKPEVDWPLGNVWLGVSVEDRAHKSRIDILRETPAPVRFLSLEPLLEDLGELDLRGIDWVIVGGESGPGARPMNPDWARSIRDQCVAAGVPFFFKQWGEYVGTHIFDPEMVRVDSGLGYTTAMKPVGKKAAGSLLDGREWNEMPGR